MSDAYFQKGLGLRMLGELQPALEAFTESIEMSLSDPRANASEGLLRRGIIHFQQDDLELAKADFEKSIRYTPRGYNPRAYFWLGLCYQNQNDINRAVTEYTRALRLQPSFVNALFNRGLAHMNQGRFARATRDFNEVLRIDRNNEQARSLRSQAMDKITAP
jgi:tetratricopeptide (TPR) repeat protein